MSGKPHFQLPNTRITVRERGGLEMEKLKREYILSSTHLFLDLYVLSKLTSFVS